MKTLFLILCVAIITVISEAISAQSFHLGSIKITLLPMLFAVVMGIFITPEVLGKKIEKFKKIIDKQSVEMAGSVVMIALLPLAVKYGNVVSGSLDKILKAGPALMFQEFGNLASIFVAIPIAYALGLRREAIGACSSIDREPSLGVIAEKYGASSPECMGVMGVYLTGSIVGTIFFSIIPPLGLNLGFDPLSLSAACGIGSGSMLAACSTAMSNAKPELADTIIAYGAVANTIATMVGVYVLIFIGLPLANFIYNLTDKFANKLKGKK